MRRALPAAFASMVLALSLLPALPSRAQIAAGVAPVDAQVERRVTALSEQLRCLVCQNESLADSNAPLALDLKNSVREQVQRGHSDDQIRRYMVERYGDFVLYKPPFKVATLLLWLGPFALLLVGGVVLARRLTAPPADAPVAPEQLQRAARLLEPEPRKGEP